MSSYEGGGTSDAAIRELAEGISDERTRGVIKNVTGRGRAQPAAAPTRDAADRA